MKAVPCLALAILSLGMIPPRVNAAGVDTSASELLAHYVRHVDGLGAIQYRLRKKITSNGGVFPDWTWVCTSEATFVRSGVRWRCRLHEVGFQNHESTKYSFETETENAFDGKVNLYVDRVDQSTQSLADMDEATAERFLRSGVRGNIETVVVAEVDAERPTAPEGYKAQNESCDLYGFLPADGLTVADILRDPATRLTTRSEVVDGRPCRVLDGATTHGQVSLWLDPAASFAPVRPRVVKGESDLMGQVAMKTLKASTSPFGAEPKRPMRGMEIQIDYRISPVAGRPMIVGYTRLDRFLYQGGVDFPRRDVAELSDIRFDPPPRAVEPTLVAIPVETPVVVRPPPPPPSRFARTTAATSGQVECAEQFGDRRHLVRAVGDARRAQDGRFSAAQAVTTFRHLVAVARSHSPLGGLGRLAIDNDWDQRGRLAGRRHPATDRGGERRGSELGEDPLGGVRAGDASELGDGLPGLRAAEDGGGGDDQDVGRVGELVASIPARVGQVGGDVRVSRAIWKLTAKMAELVEARHGGGFAAPILTIRSSHAPDQSMWSRSSMIPASRVGCQPSRDCVRALDAGMSIPANIPSHPKWLAASSGDMETTGIFRPRPIASAISRAVTPSSATA